MKNNNKICGFWGKNWGCGGRLVCLCEYLQIGVLIIGSFAGVGFLSGAEIVEFFMRVNNFWWGGLVVFSVLFFCLMLKILDESLQVENEFNLQNLNKYYVKNTFLTKLKMKIFLTNLSALLVSGAMISGLRNLIYLLFNNNHFLIFCLCLIVIFLLLIFGVECLGKVNFLMMILLLFMAVMILLNFVNQGVELQFKNNDVFCELNLKNVLSSTMIVVCYVFMNITQVKSVCCVRAVKMKRRERFCFALAITMVITFIIASIMLFIYNNISLITTSMPMFEYFKNCNKFVFYVFVFGLFLGLTTTLMSCLCLLKQTANKVFAENLSSTFFVLLLALLVGFLDFSVCVSVIYPLVGVLNFIIFIFL